MALARLGAGYRWHTVLGALADSLRARGIRRIAGRLVEAGDAFPGDGYGFGWAHDDFGEPYSAPVDELFVNDGIARLTFTGGRRAGAPATIRARSAAGAVPVRPPLDTLVRWESPTLAEVLPHFEKSSQNQVGELLLRALGRVADTVGTPEAGRRVAVAHLAAWGIDSTMAAARDGSGLSRHDYVAPEAIVRLLDAVRLLPDGGAFRESLPVAGGGGTLARRMRGSPAQGNVRAKTGFVDKARSLSGYVSTADGATLLFSTLCDSWTTPMGAVERAQDAIVIQLASLTLVAPDAQRC